MLTSRLPLLALLACLAALFVAGPAQAQAPATPAPQTLAMPGKDKNGKTFKGTYTIDLFRAVGNKVYAEGTLKNRKVTRENLSIPASLAGDPAAGGARAAQLSCKVLTLTLGPLDLNLLGLRVQLNQVNLRITAIPAR